MAATDAADAGLNSSDGRILTEQLQFYFQQTKDAVLGHTVIGLAVVFLLWNAGEDQTNLVIWTILMLTVAVVRIVLYRNFPDKTSRYPDATPWAWRFRAISLASGGTFGLLPVMFLETENFATTA